MSDTSVVIAVNRYTYPDATAKAKEIISWLTLRDIIKLNPSDCVLGSDEGYAISEGAKLVVEFPQDLPFGLISNGMQVTTKRAIFGEFPEEIICPACNENISEEEWNVRDWIEYNSENMLCPKCNQSSEISTYKFVPEWAFTNLAFAFWNWPEFKTAFIMEFKERLGCEVVVCHEHL